MKARKIWSWVLTVFMAASALVYFPSAASVLMLLFAAVCIPIPAVARFWESVKIGGKIKVALLLILFVAAMATVPRQEAAPPATPSEPPTAAELTEAPAETATPQPEQTPKPTPEATPEPSVAPSEPPQDAEGTESAGPLKSGTYTLSNGVTLYFTDHVRNDVTGNWRISSTADSPMPADYALEYYQTMFSSDDEIHAIWNATLGTTTRISATGGLLFVDTLEYVKGEEHDANLLFSGALLDSRVLDAETGDPVGQEG